MTTEELFREDAALDECEARIAALGETGVQLDRTVFYPLGGGQAGDRGELRLADGRVLQIADTRKGEAPGGMGGRGGCASETLPPGLLSLTWSVESRGTRRVTLVIQAPCSTPIRTARTPSG